MGVIRFGIIVGIFLIGIYGFTQAYGQTLTNVNLDEQLGIATFIQAYEQTLTIDFDQDTYILEHSAVLTFFDSNAANDGTTGQSVTINLTAASASNTVVPILAYEVDDTGIFKSYFVKFTTDPTGPSEIRVSSSEDRVRATMDGISDDATAEIKSGDISLNNNYRVYKKTVSDIVDCVADEQGGDTDGDGICNYWEDQNHIQDQGWSPGLHITWPAGANPAVHYYYPCDPSCPDHMYPDMYYEIDWMWSHKPKADAIQDVIEAFRYSNYPGTEFEPVNGTRGINLHIQIDEPVELHIDEIVEPGSKRRPGFDQVKHYWFGSFSERGQNKFTNEGNSDWEDTKRHQKMQVFHYALFAHDKAGSVGSSGSAEIQGNDLMVTLGSFDGKTGSDDQHAGTLMHEIGHNMALYHGGTDLINCKPNYVSVMSYARQFSDLIHNRTLDFSSKKLTTNIDESILGKLDLDSYNNPEELIVYGNGTGGLIFNKTGTAGIYWGDAGTDITYLKDQTYSKIICPEDAGEILHSFEDWDKTRIQLISRGHGNWVDGVGGAVDKRFINIKPGFVPKDIIMYGEPLVFINKDTVDHYVAIQQADGTADIFQEKTITPGGYFTISGLGGSIKEWKYFVTTDTTFLALSKNIKAAKIHDEKTNSAFITVNKEQDEKCYSQDEVTKLELNEKQVRVCTDAEVTIDAVLGMRLAKIDHIDSQLHLLPDSAWVNTTMASDGTTHGHSNDLDAIREDIISINTIGTLEKLHKLRVDTGNTIIGAEMSKIHSAIDMSIESHTKAVPEFGMMSFFVLTLTITAVIILASKTNLISRN